MFTYPLHNNQCDPVQLELIFCAGVILDNEVQEDRSSAYFGYDRVRW